MEEHDARNISGEVDKQKHRVVELARRLIGFKTENPAPANESGGNEAVKQGLECQQFIAERLKALGFSIDQWRLKTGLQNLVAVLKGSGGGRTILFNGHIDTVPAGDLRAWKHDPWEADISGGRICGLGSVDMKGGVAAFISAIEVALSQGLDLKGDVVVEIVPDEEMAGPGTRECLEKGYRGDAALFGEPTDLAVVVCEPGLIHLRIEVFGRGAHSSTRYQSIHAGGKGYGVNAIEKMIKVMQAIGELERQWANMKSYPPLPPGLNYIHPGVIVGGPGGGKDGKLTRQPENPGTFPDYCSAEYELKFYPDEDIEKVKEAFEKHLFHLCQLDPWLKEHPPKVTWGLRGIYFPPAQTPATHPIVQTVTQAHRSKGRSVRISGYAAVTDMCWYSSQNVPSVVYGPGEIHLAHSPEESLLIEDLLYATTVYAETILRWCS